MKNNSQICEKKAASQSGHSERLPLHPRFYFRGLRLGLRGLALHTQHLLQDPQVSLFISEPDGPDKNPLALRRMNLQGDAVILTPEEPGYPAVKASYLARFPASAMMFGFGDFSLWELRLTDAHLVLGFGQAYQSTVNAPATWIHQRPEPKK